MESSVSPKDEICFLRVCHHISTGLYYSVQERTLIAMVNGGFRRVQQQQQQQHASLLNSITFILIIFSF